MVQSGVHVCPEGVHQGLDVSLRVRGREVFQALIERLSIDALCCDEERDHSNENGHRGNFFHDSSSIGVEGK
jgi:hypothetical protein